jgi:hemolysin III
MVGEEISEAGAKTLEAPTDLAPRLFGFHEVFHALTMAAFACHYAAVSLLACRA